MDDREQDKHTVCLFCKGTGVCGKCDGRGMRAVVAPRRKTMVTCNACDGSRVCQLCHGAGVVGAPSKSTA